MSTSENGKQRFYDSYVTSGQAATPALDVASGRGRWLEFLASLAAGLSTNSLIVDAGCGSGDLVHRLRSSGWLRAIGFDSAQAQVAAAQAEGIDGIEQRDIEEALIERQEEVELLYVVDVLEHLDLTQLHAVMSAASASLRPGGRLVLQVPNARSTGGMTVRYDDLTHERAFSRRSISQLVSTVGLELTSLTGSLAWDKSAKGRVRCFAFEAMVIGDRIRSFVETGSLNEPMTRNLVAIATKPSDDASARTH